MTNIENIPLERCRFGHEHPLANVNSRRSLREKSRHAMMDSLADKGQLQPGRAFPAEDDSGDVYVFIGNRRLDGHNGNLALGPRSITGSDGVTKAFVPPTTMQLIIDRDITPREALDLSFEENEQREPLHPIDRYEDYDDLRKQGLDAEAIGLRHGLTARTVQQYLALGALSPKIREAWRAGEIDDATAKAFTLGKDHKTQDKLFTRLEKFGELRAHRVRDELLPGDNDPRFINFIGTELYELAGGTVIKDLFLEKHGVSDPVLARTLAGDKLDEECTRIKEGEGWSWVAKAETLPRSWQAWARSEVKIKFTDDERLRRGVLEAEMDKYPEDEPFESQEESDRYDVLFAEYEGIEQQAALRGYSDRAKKKSGVAIWIDEDGRLVRMMGLIRPAQEPESKVHPAKPADADDDEELELPTQKPAAKPAAVPAAGSGEGVKPAISAAHEKLLADTFADGLRVAIKANPHVALSALLARLGIGNGCLHFTPQALSRIEKLSDARTFQKALESFGKMKDAGLIKVLASAVSALCEPDDEPFTGALVQALGARAVTEALRKRHNFGEDFERRPKPLLLEVVREALGKEEEKRVALLSREKLTVYCKANVPATGWLPPELRVTGYTLPAAAKAGAKKPAPAKAKPAKKKGKR